MTYFILEKNTKSIFLDFLPNFFPSGLKISSFFFGFLRKFFSANSHSVGSLAPFSSKTMLLEFYFYFISLEQKKIPVRLSW
jgi:hypothetical protein